MSNLPELPDQLLRAALARDPARPLVTFYDDASGERIELSVTTFENWVAKTANLLVDGLGVEPGARVALTLPLHWQTAVWVGACWAVGATPVLGADADADADSDADVVVTGPELPEPLPRTADVVALSLRPMGARFAEPLPAGVLDYAAEVLGHGDRFVAPPAEPGTPALAVDGQELSAQQLIATAQELARRWGLDAGGRLLTELDPSTHDGAFALLAVPLAVDGSVVLVRNGGASPGAGSAGDGDADAGDVDRTAADEAAARAESRRTAERITATATAPLP